ncbi:MAG: FtsX-like permease family protein [Clostridia bacterium]
MKNALLKDTLKEIKSTKKRFISILLIILLGAGFYAGIKAISPDMKIAADMYYDKTNFMDFKLLSTLGITNDDINEVKKVEGIKQVQPATSLDALIKTKEQESAIILSTIPIDKVKNNEQYINQLDLIEGTMPQNFDECIVDKKLLQYNDFKVGDQLEIIVEDKDMSDKLTTKKFKIVGVATSPTYLSADRGTSTLGSGKVIAFVYIPDNAIKTDIYTELYVSIEGSRDLNSFSSKYEDYIKPYEKTLEDLGKIRKDIRYEEVVEKGRKKLDDAKEKLESSKKEADEKIKSAEEDILKAKTQILNSEANITKNEKDANAKFKEADAAIKSGREKIIASQTALNENNEKYKPLMEAAQAGIDQMNSSINSINAQITNNNSNIISYKNDKIQKESKVVALTKSLAGATPGEIKKINDQINILNTQIGDLNVKIQTLEATNKQLQWSLNTLNSNLSIASNELASNKAMLYNAQVAIDNAKDELDKNAKELKSTKNTTYSKLNSGKNEIVKAKEKLAEGEVTLEEQRQEANDKIKEAEEKIADARKKLDEIKSPQWYVLNRNTNPGYYSYYQDSDRIAAVAQLFPVIFFIVAALVSLTSMTRMVEEQRNQIGTLKALGYSTFKIASKYIIYSILASLIGSLIGIVMGLKILPIIVFNVYKMLYNMPDVVTQFNIEYALLAVLVSVFCTTLATIVSCIKELKEVPASLMRPKAPKMGKRVLLERIHFIWKRLNFTQKVTARNILRYKKRFFMTVIGIGGCTGLLLAGFGVKDSVSSMAPMQFENIFNYKLDILLKDDYTKEELTNLEDQIKNVEEITDYTKINEQAIKFKKGDFKRDGQIVVVPNIDEIGKYINLQHRVSKKKIVMNEDSVILTEKMAKMLGVKVGDTITLENSDDISVDVKITDITENYVYHYIYMSKSNYEKIYSEKVKENKIILNTTDNIDQVRQDKIVSELLQNKSIILAEFTTSTFNLYTDAMKSLNSVVLVLIISAGLLAFIVLYNLSNINISERMRELATIKVLGFYDKEVTAYVYRENLVLTIIGTAVGLVMGYFLNMFIIKTCEVDLVMFGRTIKLASYILSIIITLVFSAIVNIVTHFELKKIDMIESLKSVE